MVYNLLTFLIYAGLPYWDLCNNIREGNINELNEKWFYFAIFFLHTNKHLYFKLCIQVIFTLKFCPTSICEILDSHCFKFTENSNYAMPPDQIVKHINKAGKSAITFPHPNRVMEYHSSYNVTNLIYTNYLSTMASNSLNISKRSLNNDILNIEEWLNNKFGDSIDKISIGSFHAEVTSSKKKKVSTIYNSTFSLNNIEKLVLRNSKFSVPQLLPYDILFSIRSTELLVSKIKNLKNILYTESTIKNKKEDNGNNEEEEKDILFDESSDLDNEIEEYDIEN